MNSRTLRLLALAISALLLSACAEQDAHKQAAFAPQPGASNVFVRRLEPAYSLPATVNPELILTGANEYQKRQISFDYGGTNFTYFLVVLPESKVSIETDATVNVYYGGAFVQGTVPHPTPPADWVWVHTERVGASAEGSELLVRAEGANGSGIHRVIFESGTLAWVKVNGQPKYIWTDKAKFQEIDVNLVRTERPVIGFTDVENLITTTRAAVHALGL